MPEAMTAERLAEIRDELRLGLFMDSNARELLADVERLRGEPPLLRRWMEAVAANKQLEAENAKLRAFKDFVHQRLDAMGVPVDPPGEHRDAGCRIGQRLDWVQAERPHLTELVCENLPEDWEIELKMRKGEADINLVSPDGDDVEICDDDSSFVRCFMDRIDHAREADGLQPLFSQS